MSWQDGDRGGSPVAGAWRPRTRFTTSQPYSFRDTMTILQEIEVFKKFIKDLSCRINKLAEEGNQIADELQAQLDGHEAHLENVDETLENIQKQIDDLSKAIDKFVDQAVVYNPTRGQYTTSWVAMNDLYRELAVHGMKVQDAAEMTVEELAKHGSLEIPAIGLVTTGKTKDPTIYPTGKAHDEENTEI